VKIGKCVDVIICGYTNAENTGCADEKQFSKYKNRCNKYFLSEEKNYEKVFTMLVDSIVFI
jgi:hypothetical protein